MTRDNLRGQKSLGPLKMSLEMAHKVIVPQKKNYVPQFLQQRDINSYYVRYSTLLHLPPLRFQCAEDAGIEPMTVATIRHWLSDAPTTRLDLIHLLKLKCAHSPLNLRLLSSTSVPFTLTTPNLALTHTKRFTVFVPVGRMELGFSSQ